MCDSRNSLVVCRLTRRPKIIVLTILTNITNISVTSIIVIVEPTRTRLGLLESCLPSSHQPKPPKSHAQREQIMRQPLVWLSLLLLTLLASHCLGPSQSAILHQSARHSDANRRTDYQNINNNNINNIDHDSRHSDTRPKSLDNVDHSKLPTNYHNSDQTLKPNAFEGSSQIATKFVILTTGQHIKLYPFQPNAPLGPNGSASQFSRNMQAGDFHYLVKPKLVDVRDHESFKQFGNNTLARWLIELSNTTSRSDKRVPKSILPQSDDDVGDDDRSLVPNNSESGWIKPMILDVDYLFDDRFCSTQYDTAKSLPEQDQQQPQQLSTCLVIVWLDERNKYLRLGSVDLRTNPIHYPSVVTNLPVHSYSHKNRNSDKQEKNIIWLKEFPPVDLVKSAQIAAVNRSGLGVFGLVVDRRRNVLHVALGNTQVSPDRVLSGILKPDRSDGAQFQLDGETLHTFNECPSRNEPRQFNLENLRVDDDTGHWLFYSDTNKIVALNLVEHQFGQAQDSARPNKAVQAVVRDISMQSHKSVHMSQEEPYRESMAMAVESGERRFYWLSNSNKLFSCNYIGGNVKFVGQLPSKPRLRFPGNMHIHDNVLYVSDKQKNYLVAYNLKQIKQSNDDYNIENPQDNNNTMYRVLLIESPLLSFRVIDLYEQVYASSIGNEQLNEGPQIRELDWLDSEAQDNPCRDFLRQLYNGHKFYSYEQLMVSSKARSICSTNSDAIILSDHQGKLFTLLLELFVLYMGFLIWLCYPWIKRNVSKQVKT